MVHLEHAALARGAVVGAVRLLRLAFVTEAHAPVRCLHREGCVLQSPSFLRGQVAVAIVEVEGRAGIGEDGGRVAPVEHEVQKDAERGRELACVKVSMHMESSMLSVQIGDAPVHAFFDGTKPMPASTHTAHDVRP